MARNRVSSFFERWSHPRSPPSPSAEFSPNSASPSNKHRSLLVKEAPSPAGGSHDSTAHIAAAASRLEGLVGGSPSPGPVPSRPRANTTGSRSSSRPSSMVQTYQPPLMEVANDTPPELQPIFTFLNSHSNKLYQEGYFLKLHDLDTRGRPSSDRTWQECFAQLVGTVLSLWDAAELDNAGEDGEVVPTFINLADASIKMIESLPMNEGNGQQLQNVLSISTAANNRYLLHFNSLNSLTQWTAGIRLAMYEHATLQEAYTGSLVAGKGKTLNNIRQILERNKFKHEDWARVRFGAGTPWRRCWFVVSPPDEKDWEKAQKEAKKNKYAKPRVLKGDVKFYETRKVTKRTRPIATITNAYSAYAIYPQSKPLIDQSTLVKIEGRITIHSMPETTTEGFVFVMPEVHPAISGFEMMLRFLFPVWDTFALYGRPTRLIADVLDQRGLMFALPRDRRYGYLEILDVAGLIHSEGSANWNERQWRRQLKELTSKRMLALKDDEIVPGRKKSASRTSLPGTRTNTLRFEDSESAPPNIAPPRRAESALAGVMGRENNAHRRAASEANGFGPYQHQPLSQSNLSASPFEDGESPPPRPPPHSAPLSSESLLSDHMSPPPEVVLPPEVKSMGIRSPPPEPVDPPNFAHAPSEKPRTRPNQAPDLRRGYSNLDEETRAQMAEATGRPTYNAQPQYMQNQPVQNGYAYGQQDHYRRPNGSRGTSPDTKSRNGYGRNGPSPNRLSTIPASPFIEQDSPILDRAGQVLAPPTVPENGPPNLAASAAMAALSTTPSYSRPSTEGQPQIASHDHQHVNASVNPRNSAGSGTSDSQRPDYQRTFSVSRKPVGCRTSAGSTDSHYSTPPAQAKESHHTSISPPANAQWNPQQYQYQGYENQDPYAAAQQQSGPYAQAGQGDYFPPAQQGPPPPMHAQVPHHSHSGQA